MGRGDHSLYAMFFVLCVSCLFGRGEAADLTLRYVHHPVAAVHWEGLDETGTVQSDGADLVFASNMKHGYQVIASNRSKGSIDVSTVNRERKKVAAGEKLVLDFNSSNRNKIHIKMNDHQKVRDSQEVVTFTVVPR